MSTLWSKDQIEIIKQYKSVNKEILTELSKKLNKTESAIDKKCRRIGIPYVAFDAPTNVANQKKADISGLIIQSLKEKLENIKPYIVSKQDMDIKADIKGDTLVIQITDTHAGKIVKNQEGEIIYNEEIFRVRINRLCEQILKLLDTNISKGVPIIEVAILLTGDLANGEGIYLTQAYEQEIAPPAQVMLVINVLTKLIVSLLKRNLPVKVYGIRGNHGRTGKDTNVASNWDIMIYMILDFWGKFVLKNSKFQITYTENESLKFNIRGHGYLIRHIAPEQVDSPAGRVKINEWARRYNVEGIVYGHYHHVGIFDCDSIRVFRGGSTVGGDSLSDSMAKHSEPIQLIWGVNSSRVSTFIYLVDLGESKNESK
jgi:predicted phosphodiesterase